MGTRHRRASFTIWMGHLPEEYREMAKNGDAEVVMNLYFDSRKEMLSDWKKERNSTLRGCAMSLEVGGTHGGIHVQGYIELRSARSWAHYAKRFRVLPECFQTTRSGVGSFEYCSKSGSYSDKDGVLETYLTGPREDFRLHDVSGDSKADLKQCVGYIVEGYHPVFILKNNPYAYTVHRSRIWALWHDLQEIERTGTLGGPPELERSNL